jgi:murein tripeptide amidase MpaA
MIIRISVILVFLSQVYLSFGQEEYLKTYYENSGYKETPRYDETVSYCKELAKASSIIRFTNFGISPQGRELPLLIVDKNRNFEPEKVRNSGNAVLMIQACIHAGECEGKDAGLMLVRDLVTNNISAALLDHVTLLFIPIFNADGHERFGPYNRINQNGPVEMGWRATAQNLNLNRDFLKADAPEMQCWLKLFNRWLPEFFIDCHTTDGADYQYSITYGMEIFGNMDSELTAWQKDVFLKNLSSEMKDAGYPIIQYVYFRNWHDPRSGLVAGVSPPILSTGYVALRNCAGLLIETHMLKDYKTRVSATYQMLVTSLSILNKNYKYLLETEKRANEYCSGKDFRKNKFPLDFEASMKDSIMIDFKGIDYTAEKSNLTGGTWFKYNGSEKDLQIPYFNKVEPVVSIQLPEAYIIPPEWLTVIERLRLHGIQMRTLKEAANILVTTTRFRNAKWQEKPYEGRHNVKFDIEEKTEEQLFPAGSLIIDMNQNTARIIASVLDPSSDYSLVHWGFFDSVFEQKEYSETYVMEGIARKMLENDPLLKKEYEEKKSADKNFATDQWEILNWFYNKSQYSDKKMNMYPVGKIFDRKVIESLNVID